MGTSNGAKNVWETMYLNPGKFFALRQKDKRQAARLRSLFMEDDR